MIAQIDKLKEELAERELQTNDLLEKKDLEIAELKNANKNLHARINSSPEKANQQQKLVDSASKTKQESNCKGGILEVYVVEANLDRDTELFGKMDPFAELTIG